MTTRELTDVYIRSVKPPPKGRQHETFDSVIRALSLRVSPGGTKTWFLIARVRSKQTRIKLGRYPALSLHDARDRARKLKTEIRSGIDPRSVRREDIGAEIYADKNTFKFYADRFMSEHAEQRLKRTTIAEYRRALFVHCASWAKRHISSITRDEVRLLIRSLEDDGRPGAARNLLRYLSKFFTWTMDQIEGMNVSPTNKVVASTPRRDRDRVLTIEELREVWRGASTIGHPFGTIIKVLILTGQRRDEVSEMKWSELHELCSSEPYWELPGKRSKNKRGNHIPLSTATKQIF